MNCPNCHGKTHIVDSRPLETGTSRRRECDACQHRFTTIEAMAVGPGGAGELAQKIESKIEELMILLAQAGEVAAYLKRGRQPGPTVNTASAAKKRKVKIVIEPDPEQVAANQGAIDLLRSMREGKKRAKAAPEVVDWDEQRRRTLERAKAKVRNNGNEGKQ